MDPKGDRLRRIQEGTLKLPESVLKNNTILLTQETPKPGGGCIEGGAMPRPVSVVGITDKSSADTKPLMIGNDGSLKLLDTSGIPLPNDADIPLPPNLVPETDIPLPSPLSSENIPLPKDSDIPLPPDDLIPLPADKPPQQQQKKKVSLTRLVPTGDELLCRSCEMKFTKQVDYDTHLQTDSHQQAIEDDLKQGRSHGVGLPIPKQNKKSPSHDIKPGHVSFGFLKTNGPKISNAQPFHQQRTERAVFTEIKPLKVGSESPIGKVDTPEVAVSQTVKTEKVHVLSSLREECQENRLLCSFVKVQSKDDSGRVLDWPKEMILYTQTEPKITYSCNPLCFDFSQLFGNKTKKSTNEGTLQDNVKESNAEGKLDTLLPDDKNDDISSTKIDEEKKKSHKKKKKKKHKKNKDKIDDKDITDAENKEVNTENKLPEDGTKQDAKQDGTEVESTTGKKKKKRKHKKKEKDVSKEEDEKDKSEDCVEKEKKKHKKSKKKKHQSEGEDENKIGEEEKKSKKRKKSKKSKKRKRKHLSDKENEKSEVEEDLEKKIEKNGENTDTSADESDAEKDLNGKKKRKKRKKSKKKDGGSDSSDDELGSNVDKQENVEKVTIRNGNSTVKKNSVNDSGIDNEKIVPKLLAMKSSKPKVLPNWVNPTVTPTIPIASKKITEAITDKKLDRKRVNSEPNVSESASTNPKKMKLTPKTVSGMKETIKPSATVTNPNSKVEKDESWVRIENQTHDNVKSKWDTSDSDMENALDETVEKEKNSNLVSKVPKMPTLPNAQKKVKSHQTKPLVKKDSTDIKKAINPSTSQRSNMSAGSTKKTPASAKSNKKVQSPVSSRSSRSRSHSYRRSYSSGSSRSRSHSYSSTSSYSSGYSHSHRRKRKHSSSRSYSRSSRSRSRSYHRGRGRSSSYSSSYSRSYSSSRSRSRSHRRRRRRRSYTRSRTYSSSSYSSRSRSRSRSYRRKSRRKTHRRNKSTKQKPISVATTEKELPVKTKPAAVKETSKGPNVDPSDIPLPDLSGKKDDVKSEEKLAKLKDKKPRTDVGQTVAKLVESLPSDIPLPFSETSANTVSSDALPSSPPTTATKECESGFIGPKLPNTNMAPPPPPPPGHVRFPNHGPPHPGYYPNHWDHWGGPPGPWDGPGHWDGPGPGPRPYRGMRPPFEQRMAGPFDPRMRRPPPYMARHGPMHMGPRYPGPRGPPHEYDYDYDYPQEYETQYAENEPPKKEKESPPPLPPPKAPSPKPPPPEKKEKQDKEPEQNPNIVIPPEQAEQYKHLQKQAAKHARRQRRRQQKKELGEPEEDSTSSESEPEPSEEQETEVGEDEQQYIVDEMQPQMIAVPQQFMLSQQPQPASSPGGIVVAVSNGQQIILQKQPQLVQNGLHVQAGQPVILSQNAMLAAAASGAQPAHIVQQVQSGLQAVPTGQIYSQSHIPQGIQVIHSSASLQHLHQLQQLQQIQQAHHIQQIQQAQAIQAHNQAVAAAHAAQQHTGPIIVGNQILVPRFGVRPAM